MFVAEALSFTFYVLTLVIFKSQFDAQFLKSWDFVWRVSVVTLISCLPLGILKFLRVTFKPPVQQKLMQYATLK